MPRELDLEWIASVTGASRARPQQRIQSLWSGYGEILRVSLQGASRETAIVKWVTPDRRPASDVSHARKRRSYDIERHFYEHFAPRSRKSGRDVCRLPVLLGSRKKNSPEEWLFVLEDLDAEGFDQRSGGLEQCLAWLAGFHGCYFGVSPEGLWREGTYWHLATRLAELDAIQDLELRHAATAIDQKLVNCTYRTLVHGDAKVDNFCFGRQSVAAVDFQYVGGGSGMRDVAYLIAGEPNESRLLDGYFRALRAQLPADLANAVENEWRLLYPIACADFYRFLAGWAPAQYRHDGHAHKVVRQVLASL